MPQSFDDLLLMKYGGNVIYHGHLGQRSHRLIKYFLVSQPCTLSHNVPLARLLVCTA